MIEWNFKSIKISESNFVICTDQLEAFNELFELKDGYYVFYTTKERNLNIFMDDDTKVESEENFLNFLSYYNTKNIRYSESQIRLISDTQCGLFINEINHLSLFYDEIDELEKSNSYSNRSLLENVSPFIFSYILNGRSLNYIQELLSLIVIADFVNFADNRIDINLNDGFEKSYSIEIPWAEWDYFGKNTLFFNSLKWIVNNNVGGINARLKKTIVKNHLVDVLLTCKGPLSKIVFSSDYIKKYDKTLDLVISNRSKEYFKMQENLKEDKSELFRRHIEIIQKLNTNLFSLIAFAFSTIVVEFVTSNKNSISDILKDKLLMQFIIAILLIGFVLILMMFFYNVHNYNRYISIINSINNDLYGESSIIEKEHFRFYYIIFIIIGFSFLISIGLYF